jgi:hypothetical protein
MWKERHGLAEPFVRLAPGRQGRKFRDSDSKQYRYRVAGHNVYQIKNNGVAGNAPSDPGHKKKTKVLKTVPGAAENTQVVPEVLKRENDTRHGYIGHDKHKDNRGRNHRVELSVLANLAAKPVFFLYQTFLLLKGASPLRGDRAIRSNLVYRFAAHKYFRFYPLRGPNPASLPDFGLGVTAPSMAPR